jgi:microcin C transport system substrate-binding protein
MPPLLADVAACDVVDERTVRFRFKKSDRSCRWWWAASRLLAQVGHGERQDQALRPGHHGHADRHRPLQDRPVRFGKDVTYVRDPNYWGRNLPCARGMNNFDRITSRSTATARRSSKR